MALTKGGPGYDSHSLSTLVNRTYFGSENAGYASSIWFNSLFINNGIKFSCLLDF